MFTGAVDHRVDGAYIGWGRPAAYVAGARPMMVSGDYSDATMKVETWQKDMTIIGDFARKLKCRTPLFLTSASIYTAAMVMGWRSEDIGVVCAVVEKVANYTRPSKPNGNTAPKTTD